MTTIIKPAQWKSLGYAMPTELTFKSGDWHAKSMSAGTHAAGSAIDLNSSAWNKLVTAQKTLSTTFTTTGADIAQLSEWFDSLAEKDRKLTMKMVKVMRDARRRGFMGESLVTDDLLDRLRDVQAALGRHHGVAFKTTTSMDGHWTNVIQRCYTAGSTGVTAKDAETQFRRSARSTVKVIIEAADSYKGVK